jgi:hypothetical protein
MEKITEQAMAELVADAITGPAVTMYVPMHKAATSPAMTENQIRLKNLVRKAKDTLEQQGGNHKLTVALQEFLDNTLNDQSFWDMQTNGLLICATEAQIRVFQLPVDTEEYVAVDTSFHLTPVLGLLHDTQDFYVLTVAQHNPRLYKGSLYGLEPTGIKLPESIEAGLNIDENNQKSEQSLSAGGSSLNTNAFNGRGGARDPREEDRARFFRMVDHIITEKADRKLPLVLAGIDAEIAEFRGLSKHSTLTQTSITKGTNNMSLDELFADARHIVYDELIAPKHQEALDTYKRMSATAADRTANNPTTIREAAEQGRVGTLLLGMSRLTTDTVGTNEEAVARFTFPSENFKDAVNNLALAVHNTSGEVIIVDESELPSGQQMAAVLRY